MRGSGIMCVALMDDPTRGVIGSQPPDEPQNMEPRDAPAPVRDSNEGSAPAIASGRPGPNPKFIGDAMRSLYRSSATSIERGDATRVIGRNETESLRPAPSVPPKPQTTSSVPAGPRVDVTLWLVLALGLFAIAGFMLSAAL
jgi:hypothetical protein